MTAHRPSRSRLTILLGIAVLVGVTSTTDRVANAWSAPDARGAAETGRYVVTVRPDVDAQRVADAVGAEPTFVYTASIDGFAAELTSGQVASLGRDARVRSVERDGRIEGDGVQSMDTGGQPWGLDRIDQRSRVRDGRYHWSGTGAGVTVYVIDSGIQTTHPDFGGRAVNVFDAWNGNGEDCHGHGTHVAATIGGATYGVAKRVRLRGVKVLDCQNKGSYAGMIAGVEWVRLHAVRPAVVNMSVSAARYAPLNDAVTRLVAAGIFVAVAAGNANRDACGYSPASAKGTLTVSSSDWLDHKASDSNWGRCVDVYAPGVGIRSARLGGGSITMSGTSMATPHVTGIAALILGDYGEVAPADLVTYVLGYATTGVISGNPSETPDRLLYQAGW
jgi:subtilisin family serine protease